MEDRLDSRLLAIEDRLAILQTLSAYPIAVDGLNAETVVACHSPDAVYEVGDLGAYRGHAGIAGIVEDPDHGHIARVAEGVGHIATTPYIVAGDDRAVATLHMFVPRHGETGFRIWRLSASRISLRRQPDGEWKISRRVNHLLDGAPAGPALLGRMTEPLPG